MTPTREAAVEQQRPRQMSGSLTLYFGPKVAIVLVLFRMVLLAVFLQNGPYKQLTLT